MRAGWVQGGVWDWVGTGEGLYRVLPSRQGRTPQASTDSGAGPGSPKGAGVGGQCAASPYVRTHPPGPVLPVPGTPWCSSSRMPPPGQYRRDSTSFPVKLVKRTKCHRNMCIRPPIVPNSKNGSKSQLLKFLDFHFSQPSLTRN